ncbi:MAG TPA: alpha/beta hydrolase [Gaiellaceae bacterium]|nr:alpha/beta hydrolase [Gaiellaceae bacterium]
MATTSASDGATIYYEIHGDGEPLVLMGGWGTFCHGKLRDAPRALVAGYQVLTLDYRGLGESTDVASTTPSTAQYADDLVSVLDDAGWGQPHFMGMVGMGACVGQQLAIRHPTRVRSLVMTGTWARCDRLLADQLEMFRRVHVELGFPSFQLLAAALSFEPAFYEHHRDRILGPTGAWSDLDGRAEAHARLIEACLDHDTSEELERIEVPTLVVHAGSDVLTGPRLTKPLEDGIPEASGVMWPELAHIVAGKEQKIAFDRILTDFLSVVAAPA